MISFVSTTFRLIREDIPRRYSSTTLPSAVPPDFTTGMAADSAESESGKSDAELGGAGCAGFVETGEFSE